MNDGLLDTNLFVHAHTSDAYAEECRAFLAGLEAGAVLAYLDPMVLHELSYALPHYIKQLTRSEVAAYLLMVVAWPGVQGDKDVMVDAVLRWQGSLNLSFVDSYLAALAIQRGCPIYSKNVRELTGQGVSVPQPLPTSTEVAG